MAPRCGALFTRVLSIVSISGGLLRLKLETSVNVITATAVLHNICETHGVPVPTDAPPNTDDNPDEDDNPPHRNFMQADGRNARNRIVQQYFMGI